MQTHHYEYNMEKKQKKTRSIEANNRTIRRRTSPSAKNFGIQAQRDNIKH